MAERIFLAGASGAIGSALIPLLLAAGHEVHGTTRRENRAAALRSKGVNPVVVDVLDAAGVREAMLRVMPTVVIHQLTDLALIKDPAKVGEALASNARIRREGTPNLVAAALASGCGRMVTQSIAWVYAPGPTPHTEDQPLNLQAAGGAGISVDGVAVMEASTLDTPGLRGTVLRYGQLYGPLTGRDVASGLSCPLHVDAAACGALLAMQANAVGIYNMTESCDDIDSSKARRELSWNDEFRLNR